MRRDACRHPRARGSRRAAYQNHGDAVGVDTHGAIGGHVGEGRDVDEVVERRERSRRVFRAELHARDEPSQVPERASRTRGLPSRTRT
jgi:hypothetical protein